MALSFTRATWKGGPSNHVEYCDLKTGSKFVKLREEKKVVRELIKKEGMVEGKFKDVEYKRDFLDVSYPGYDVNVITVPAKERGQYFLVVDHTRRTANPVHKEKFEWNYSPGAGKIKGDSSVNAGAPAVNPDEDARLKKINKEKEKRK